MQSILSGQIMSDKPKNSGELNDTWPKKSLTHEEAKRIIDSIDTKQFKKCPFCGSYPTIYFQPHDLDDWKVECSLCGSSSCPEGIRYDLNLAIRDWEARLG